MDGVPGDDGHCTTSLNADDGFPSRSQCQRQTASAKCGSLQHFIMGYGINGRLSESTLSTFCVPEVFSRWLLPTPSFSPPMSLASRSESGAVLPRVHLDRISRHPDIP